MEPDDAEVPGAVDRLVANRPEVRNGPEFDSCVHVATDEIVNALDLNRIDRFVADPLARRLRPRAEGRRIEAIPVQHCGPKSWKPVEFDRMNAWCNGAELLGETDFLMGVSWPSRHSRAGARRKTLWDHSAPIVWPPPHSDREMRDLSAAILPGSQFRRHLQGRSSVVWQAPGTPGN